MRDDPVAERLAVRPTDVGPRLHQVIAVAAFHRLSERAHQLSGFQMVQHHAQRHDARAQSVQHGRQQDREAFVLWRRGSGAGPQRGDVGSPFVPAVSALGALEQRQLGHVIHRLHGMAFQQRRRGDERHFTAAEILRAHARHIACMKLDLRVEPFGAVARMQQARADVDADLGVQFEKLGQPGQQEKLRKGRRHRHVQGNARSGIGDQRVGFVDKAHRRADAFQIQRAGVGQPQASGHPFEKRRAQPVFQRCHVFADRTLGQV
ncbi:MAG TPA: hypothetical protein DCR74_19450 [Achromobacter sp.]|nr:hypothetical protein [Achromobacter sp.]